MGRDTENLVSDINYWREYPERDVEFVRWYPCRLGRLSQDSLFKKRESSFYIHIPFCNNICTSCPYNKFNTKPDIVDRYLHALEEEITLYAEEPYIQQSVFTSGYFGGGTPASLTARQLDRLLSCIYSKLNICGDASVTIETTPTDITQDKAVVLREHGVNRISIGIQSMDNQMLSNIGRNYNASRVMEALELINKAGFKHVCADLMWGLPGQTEEDWLDSISRLASSGLVDAFSIYQYIVIPSSPLYLKIKSGIMPECPGNKKQEELYWKGVRKFQEYGFKALTNVDFVNISHYKEEDGAQIETFSLGEAGGDAVKASSASIAKHITQSWYYGKDMLAAGAGAYGYINNNMYLNEPGLDRYIESINSRKLPVVMGTYTEPEERMAKMMVMGLRLLRVYRKDFKDIFGIDMMDVFADKINMLQERGLVVLNNEYIQVTYPKGWYYMENISKTFYTDKNKFLPQPNAGSTVLLDLLNP